MTWLRNRAVPVLLVLLVSQARAAQQLPSIPAADLQHVEALIQQNRFHEARTALLDELERHSSSVDGYNLLGILESDLHNYADAQGAFEKALQLSPNSTKTHNNLGNFYIVQKNPGLAEKEFRTALRLDPANRDGNYNLGLLLMAKGSPGEAIPHFERVHPQNPAVRLNLIRAYLQSKRTTEALRTATELSAQNKNDVQVHFSLGVLLASAKQYKSAYLELDRANLLQPGAFEILYNLGQVSLLNADLPHAELALTKALKLKPESPETLLLLAQTCVNQSRSLDAMDLLLRANKLAPTNTDIMLLMARISISEHFFEDAIPLLENALAIAPQRADLRSALGECDFMSGKVESAIDQFNKLIEVEPSVRSYAFLGLSYTHLGRFDEAKQSFQKGLALDPRDSFSLFHLGYIAERQGDSTAAETKFQEVLRLNPDYSDALLELANLRAESKQFDDAARLLRKYVRVSQTPATGYYKLAMVERSLHQTIAAEKDLNEFQSLSQNIPVTANPYEHLFDYLDNRSKLAPAAREQLDLNELIDQAKKHPDQPEVLYQLAEAYLKFGKPDEARSAIATLDQTNPGGYRILAGAGVLLARYHLYDDAIGQFQAALKANPELNDAKFDLANAYFRAGHYSEALDAAGQVSERERKDDAYLALLGDIYTHLGDAARAEELFRSAIARNPDNDQEYLSLALLQFRQNNLADARQTLVRGQARIPASGKILWGLALDSALEGNTPLATTQFERALELLPEWPGSYATLGVFYFQTGQIAKAREVLGRFRSSNTGGLDVDRIARVLAQTPETAPAPDRPIPMADKKQLLQFALSLADRTL